MFQLFLLGDSTCAEKTFEVYPETGWGMTLPSFISPEWKVKNRAINGRSTKLYIEEGAFSSVVSEIEPGDYCIIQFGHNENKEDQKRHTEPWTTFTKNLEFMVETISNKGGFPLFVSPVSRRNFLDAKYLMDTLGDYPIAMEKVAKENSIPFIDVTTPMRKLLLDLGPIKSKQYYMHFCPNEYPLYPLGCADDTHLRTEGASMVAQLIISLFQEHYPNLPFLF